MKNLILGLVLIAFVGVSTVACKSEKKEAPKKELTELLYACPMQCEGDKTYTDKDAKCPVCKMALVEVKHNMKENHKNH